MTAIPERVTDVTDVTDVTGVLLLNATRARVRSLYGTICHNRHARHECSVHGPSSGRSDFHAVVVRIEPAPGVA
jgi:hypothetical protein